MSAMIAIAVLALFPAKPKVSDNPPPSPALSLRRYEEAFINETPAASVSIAVLQKGRIMAARAIGKANMELDALAGVHTIYGIGSIAKQFTAAAILQLVEQGKLQLDDRVSTYIKSPETWSQVTIKELLQHSSGIPSYTEAHNDRWLPYRETTPEQILDLIIDKPLLFVPGTSHSYSNTGYFILALVIEKGAGISFADYVTKNILEPAQLRETYFCESEKLIHGRAKGYTAYWDSQLANVPSVHASYTMGAASMCSTPSDLVKWARALRTGKVISEKSYNQMCIPGPSPRYGMGMQIDALEDHQKLYHSGEDKGFSAMLATYPDADLEISVLSNTDDSGVSLLEEQIARIIFKLPPIPVLKDLRLSEGEAQQYLGEYSDPRRPILFKYHKGHLVQGTDRIPDREFAVLQYQGDGIFAFKHSKSFMKFGKAADGATETVQSGDGKTWREPRRRISKDAQPKVQHISQGEL